MVVAAIARRFPHDLVTVLANSPVAWVLFLRAVRELILVPLSGTTLVVARLACPAPGNPSRDGAQRLLADLAGQVELSILHRPGSLRFELQLHELV